MALEVPVILQLFGTLMTLLRDHFYELDGRLLVLALESSSKLVCLCLASDSAHSEVGVSVFDQNMHSIIEVTEKDLPLYISRYWKSQLFYWYMEHL